MRIFYRRPLSLILCIMLGGLSVFAFFESKFKYLLFILPPVLLFLGIVKLPIIKDYRKVLRYASLFLLITLIFSHLYFDLWFYADRRFPTEHEIEGTVRAIEKGEYSSDIEIVSDNIDDAPHSSYKLILTVDNSELDDYKLHSKIRFTARLSSFPNKSYYYSRGYSAEIVSLKELEHCGYANENLTSKFTRMRNSISDYIIKLSDEKSGGLIAALLLGERDYLHPQLALDFQRLGITHMLALSGLNLTILILGFSKLLSLCGVGKKLRYVLNIVLTFFYIALTGFPVSVVRAGVMLMVANALFLLAKSRDSLTALVFSAFIICLSTPYSVFDLGLWLSAFATLGIVVLLELPKAKSSKHLINRVLRSLGAALLISAFAVSATFAISVFSFEEVSAISPITTLIFSLPLEIFLYLGIIMLILGEVFPVGRLVIFFGDWIADFTAILSDFDYITVSSNYILLKLLTVIFTALFFGFLIFKIKRRRITATVLTLLMFAILTSAMLLSVNTKSRDNFTYRDENYSETFYISRKSDATLIQQATYSIQSSINALDILSREKVTLVEHYVVTNYNLGLPMGLEFLLSRMSVKEIYLPEPENSGEIEIFEECYDLMKVFRTKIITYDLNDNLNFNDVSLKAEYRTPYNGSGALNSFTVNCSGNAYAYLSSGMLTGYTKTAALKIISQNENIIFGRHGKAYNNYNFAYILENKRLLVFSNENMKIQKSVYIEYLDLGTEIKLFPYELKLIH